MKTETNSNSNSLKHEEYNTFANEKSNGKEDGSPSEALGENCNINERPISKSSIAFVIIVICIYVTAKTINSTAQSQYLKYRISEDIDIEVENDSYTDVSSCQFNNSVTIDNPQIYIQQMTSRMFLYLSLCENVPAVFTTLILGAYSDHIGRKFIFVTPMIGCAAQGMIYTFVSYYKLSLYVLFAAELVSGITGNLLTFLLACNAFATDITGTGKTRTIVINAVDTVGIFSLGVANIVLGFLIKYVSFTVPYLLSMVLSCVGVAIIVCCSKESGYHNTDSITRPELTELLRSIFKFYTRSQGENRVVFVLCLVIQVVSTFGALTFNKMITIYLIGTPMCWDALNIGVYMATVNIIPAVGTIIWIKVAQRCLNDVQSAIVSAAFHLVMCLVVALARVPWHLYAAVLVGAIGIGVPGLLKSVMSKKVPHGQHGAMFAGIASMEVVMVLTAGVAGNAIYETTVATFSGAVFVFQAGLFGLAIVLLLILENYGKMKNLTRNGLQYSNLEQTIDSS